MAKNAHGGALAQEAELMRKLGLQLAELKDMGLAELRAKHQELFGDEARSKNYGYLYKRLAFRPSLGRSQARLGMALPFSGS